MEKLREVKFNVLTMDGYVAHINADTEALYGVEDNIRAVIEYYINRHYVSKMFGVDIDFGVWFTYLNHGRRIRVETGEPGTWVNHVYLGTVELV